MKSKAVAERAGLVLSALAFMAFLFLFFRTVDHSLFTDWAVYGWVLACGAIYSGTNSMSAFVWTMIVRSAGCEHVARPTLMKVYFLVQIAKYIPGNVAHLMGRVVLAKKHGLSASLTAFTMFVEIAWALSIAAILGLISLTLISGLVIDHIEQIPDWRLLILVSMLAIAGPFAAHASLMRLMAWWAQRRGYDFHAFGRPSIATLAVSSVFLLLNFLTLGLILYLLVKVIFGVDEANLLVLSGIFSVSWIAGFLTPGAPAGLGVRELILIAAMTPIYGSEAAIGASALYRVVSVLGDGMTFLLGMIIARKESARFLNGDRKV